MSDELKFGDWVLVYDNPGDTKAKRFYLGYWEGKHWTLDDDMTPFDRGYVIDWNYAEPYSPKIDWTKVPPNTPVMVRRAHEDTWYVAYFACFLPENDSWFVFGKRGDTEYLYVPQDQAEDITKVTECKLLNTTDIPDEWIVEVEE